MSAWLDALGAAERDNQPAVLVTVLRARGSTPREAGAKMVISADGLAGTIGGGNLEFQCEAAARAMLADRADGPSIRDFPLGPALGQCCGGHVTVLFEVLRPPGLHIALFGAGHVGKAVIKLLADLPCRVTWIDSRPEALPATLPPNVMPLRIAQPAQAMDALSPGTVVLVMTHDHQLDLEIVTESLRRNDLQVGLIGSATKRVRFANRLAKLGIKHERIDSLICPVGLPGIEGKEPAVVAISVVAQILQLQAQVSTKAQASAQAQVLAQAEPSSRSTASMPVIERSCGDCVCPPVSARARR